MKFTSLLIGLVFLTGPLFTFAQNTSFSFDFQPVAVNNFTGIQSGVTGADPQGNLLLMAGRIDGLHKRQPWATFLPAGANTEITVLNTTQNQVWTVGIESLPVPIQEQLLSTNLEFEQIGPWLYMVGGYGYSPTVADHTTFELLTVVRVDSLIKAVQEGTAITPWFRSVSDPGFAVTGGYLGHLGDVFYIAGGQRFEGRYNPMNHATFVQTYTNAIRRFTVSDNGTTIAATFLPEWNDVANLHRRDYNMAPQVFPDGTHGFTMFSGVFQLLVDLPYLNCVDFDANGHTVNNTFQHRLNQYHSAHVALWDSTQNLMHTVFFGGIAQYFFDQNNQLVQDDNVPFVTTVGKVTRQANGSMMEEKIGDLPGLLGAGAEFVPLTALSTEDHILRMNQINGDTTLIGYIIGGISSQEPNIFFQNGDLSTAWNGVLAVRLVRNSASSIVIPTSTSVFSKTSISPNPATDLADVFFTLQKGERTGIMLQSPDGKQIVAEDLGELDAGAHQFQFRLKQFPKGVYPVTITAGQEMVTLKLVVAE